ncbi:hypothetical protein GGI24_004361 [Coemansia furcata]|nr:hypothetical protein GGI24_004361 [Coemansia furcata]
MQMHSMEPFSTLLKPYNAPPPGSLPDAHGMMPQQLSISTDNMTNGMPSFMFTPDTAQDSANMLNVFLSQLSQEQARQFSEGLQTYSVQNSAHPAHRPQPAMSTVFSARNTSAGPSERSIGSSGNGYAIANEALLANAAALHQMQSFGPAGFDASSIPTSVNAGRLQARRGSLPISSNGDLFIAPGSRPVFPTSTAPPAYVQQQLIGNDQILGSELDPMLFNPMTPFLQELQLFNTMPAQQPAQQQGMMSGGSNASASSAVRETNGHLRK